METNPAPSPMTARPVEQVQVFSSRPDRSYVEVGLLQAKQTRAYAGSNVKKMVEEIRKEAAARGCDGVLLGAQNAVASGRDSNVSRSNQQAACIVFTKP